MGVAINPCKASAVLQVYPCKYSIYPPDLLPNNQGPTSMAEFRTRDSMLSQMQHNRVMQRCVKARMLTLRECVPLMAKTMHCSSSSLTKQKEGRSTPARGSCISTSDFSAIQALLLLESEQLDTRVLLSTLCNQEEWAEAHKRAIWLRSKAECLKESLLWS